MDELKITETHYRSSVDKNNFVLYEGKTLWWYEFYDVTPYEKFYKIFDENIKNAKLKNDIVCFVKGKDLYIFTKDQRLYKISMNEKECRTPHFVETSGIVGIAYFYDGNIYFKKKIIPIVAPLTFIEKNISLPHIPPNNSQRISLFNNSLHILYSKNDSVFDAILKE